MDSLLYSFALLLLIVASFWYILSGLFGGRKKWKGPDLLHPTQNKDRDRRKQGSALIEAAVLISLFGSLINVVALKSSVAMCVLAAFAIGLFIIPTLTRTVLGLMAAVLVFPTIAWTQIDGGLWVLFGIVIYLGLSAKFARGR